MVRENSISKFIVFPSAPLEGPVGVKGEHDGSFIFDSASKWVPLEEQHRSQEYLSNDDTSCRNTATVMH